MAKENNLANNYILQLKNVSKTFEDGKIAVKNISLNVKKGEFITLLGPSGCGKTTTLRMIAGFQMPDNDGGQILLNGEDISQVPPHLRDLNTVFQRYALFPHLNVFNNVAFGLKLKYIPESEQVDKNGNTYQIMRKYTKDEIAQKVNNALKMVDLEDYGHRNVNSLSGGQMQRVAIARALVNEPQILLLDEPLGALDLKMRKDMQIELMQMHKKLGITFIYVTHDQEEALTMSDKIVIMRDGVIQQIATPKKIYDEPANAFVADFIGESNIYSGVMKKDYCVEVLNKQVECVDKGFKANEPIDVIIRPEDVMIVDKDASNALFLAQVTSVVFKGDHFQIAAETIDEEHSEILIHNTSAEEVKEGDVIGLYIKPFDFHIMHKNRIINEIVTQMVEPNVVEICGGKFPCNCEFEEGTPVKVKIDFDDVIVTDDEEDGIIGGTVRNSIYKGSYYQCIIRTDDGYDFFIDTEDDWLKDDRVGLTVLPEKIIIEKIEETANEQ
ncbi:MAG: ABC transporter ATP-binding protein [Clostridia bacterium]|nr:ABC transporter ATP-binding protein [Clostridia bacterium]